MGAVIEFLQILFDPRGRVGRGGWWQAIFVLSGLFLLSASAIIVVDMLAGGHVRKVGLGAWALALLSPTAIRRLHDRDKAGWWLAIFWVAPGVAQSDSAFLDAVEPLPSLIGAALSLWGFVEMACLRGTVGANKYGADPLAQGRPK